MGATRLPKAREYNKMNLNTLITSFSSEYSDTPDIQRWKDSGKKHLIELRDKGVTTVYNDESHYNTLMFFVFNRPEFTRKRLRNCVKVSM